MVKPNLRNFRKKECLFRKFVAAFTCFMIKTFFHKRFPLLILWMLCLSNLTASAYPFENSRKAFVDHTSVHYRYWGHPDASGKASVLLVHGFGGSSFSWVQVADSLNQMGYEVIAIDMPPFGFSDKSYRINQSTTAQAHRLHQFIQKAFPGRKWHLAGHSMGGAVAQAYALMYPDHLASVTFVAPVLFSSIQPSEHAGNKLLRLTPIRYIMGEIAEEWVLRKSVLSRMLESAYGVPPDNEQVMAYLEPLKVPGTARAILSAASWREELFTLHAHDLSMPSVAIWGLEDTWVSYRQRKSILEKMPSTRLVLIEGVGHNPMETHFEQFMEAWLPFVLGSVN